jgi:hypothetical protein
MRTTVKLHAVRQVLDEIEDEVQQTGEPVLIEHALIAGLALRHLADELAQVEQELYGNPDDLLDELYGDGREEAVA